MQASLTTVTPNSQSKATLSIRGLIAIFGGVFVLVFAALGVVGSIKIAKIKIGGEIYAGVIDGKDLVADILPPALYIIEPYVEAQSLHDEPSRHLDAKKKITALRAEYETRRDVWARSNLPDDIKAALARSAKDSVQPFWAELEGTFLPAAERRDVAASTASIARLGQLFAAHQSEISGIVAKANAYLKDRELAAANASAELLNSAIALSLVLIAILAGVYFAARSMLLKPLVALRDCMSRLAAGDLAVEVPSNLKLTDVRAMADTLAVFKQAATDKQNMEIAAEQARAAAEAERQTRELEKQRNADELAAAISALGNGLEALTHGDLTHRIEMPLASHLDKLRQDFNRTSDRLRETIGAVVGATQQMKSGTQEISAASSDLSRRTEQNAASLEETAAALGQITATVGKTAEATKHARSAVMQATADADRGKDIVSHAVAAMQKIENSSQKITQIIGVIDEIAFQTNLLALNAGVEAARAGDAGRGFAVVASEVRALAQRSADAAKEIKGLIHSSTSEVGEGAKLVAGTGEALVQIVNRINEINGVIVDIAASADEQATGLAEVNSAVNEMDKVTQQNAAMAEEATAASQSLASESEQLAVLVDQFNLGELSSSRGDELKPAVQRTFSQSPSAQLVTPKSAETGTRTPLKGLSKFKQPASRLRMANGIAGEGWKDF